MMNNLANAAQKEGKIEPSELVKFLINKLEKSEGKPDDMLLKMALPNGYDDILLPKVFGTPAIRMGAYKLLCSKLPGVLQELKSKLGACQ